MAMSPEARPGRTWMPRPPSVDQLMVAAMLVVVFAVSLFVDVQSDTWWLLRSGEHMLATGRPLTTEIWSSTVAGGYWPNHEWLSEVVFYLGYRLGGFPLLTVAIAGLFTASWYGIFRLCDAPPRFSALAVMFCQPIQSLNYALRPYVFTLMLLACALCLVPRRRLHWLYPPLFLLWANTHGGVAFGGLVLLVATAVAFAADRDQFRHWAGLTALCGALTLASPLGVGLWQLVLHTFDNPYLKTTNEWQPLSLGRDLDPKALMVAALVALTGYVMLRTRRSWRGHADLTLFVCGLIFVALSLRAVRNSAILAAVAPVMIARFFVLRRPAASPAPGAPRPLVGWLLTGLVAAGSALIIAAMIGKIPTAASERPLGPAVISAANSCPGPLFNGYTEGGFLIWWARERPVFVDNRQDPYPKELLFRADDALYGGDYPALFAEYRIACALTPHETKLDAALRRDGWRELGRDEEYAVLGAPAGR